MRAIICLLITGVALAQKYTTQYDSMDLDEVLNNNRLYKNYFNCLANKGKCSPDGKKLKDVIPNALQDGCARCNEKQRKGVEKVLRFLIEKKKADFDHLANIYDTQGVYRKKYKEEADKRVLKL